jgi:hypothetical protein
MFAGYVLLEGTLTARILVENSSGTPINADALPTFRVYGPSGYVVNGTCSLAETGTITNATNATPIVVTCTAHGLTTGARVTITGVTGNTSSNGTFTVTRVDANTFSLDDSVGNGAYSAGGTWNTTGLYTYSIACLGATGFEVSECYQVLFAYALSTTAQGQLAAFNVD